MANYSVIESRTLRPGPVHAKQNNRTIQEVFALIVRQSAILSVHAEMAVAQYALILETTTHRAHFHALSRHAAAAGRDPREKFIGDTASNQIVQIFLPLMGQTVSSCLEG